jgi:hypothetical protein
VLTKRAQVHFPKWVLQLAHKIDLKLCKVAPEIHPFLRALTRNTVDPHEVMRELLYCSSGSSPPIYESTLNSLNQFQLYRLGKVLESNKAISEALKEYSNELSENQLVDAADKQLFELLSTMHENFEAIRIESLKRRGIVAGPEPDVHDAEDPGLAEDPLADLKAQYRSLFVGAYNDMLRGSPSASIALEERLAPNPQATQARIKQRVEFSAIRDGFMTTGKVDPRTMKGLLGEAFRRLNIDDEEVRSAIAQFDNSSTFLRYRLLDSVLQFLSAPNQDSMFGLLDAHADLSKYSEADQTFEIGHVAAEFPKAEYAVWAVHDIARRFTSAEDEQELKTVVKEALRNEGVTGKHAANFMRLLKCTLEGRSAIVRDAIQEYAVEQFEHVEEFKQSEQPQRRGRPMTI